MPIATNPQTGETVYLGDDGAWKPAQTAVNPQTRQLMAHDGKDWVDVPVKSRGVFKYIDDAVRAIASGATFGFADEIAAKGNELIGRGSYEDNVKAERARDEEIPAAIKIPGQIAGVVAAVPLRGAGAGASLLQRAVYGSKVGAASGAVAGAGEGENFPDRAAKAGLGLVGGGVIGAAGVPIVEGAIQGGRVLAQPLVNAVRGAINPADEASRRVVTALERDARVDPNAANRLTPTEFAGSVQSGGPATIMDIGGETTRALARSAANTSPEGRQVLNDTIGNRFEGQSGRITDWMRSAFNYPDARAQQQAIEQTAKAVNRPAYNRAFNDPAGHALWDEGFQQLTAAPVVQDAIRAATKTGANKAAAEGFRPPPNPFEFAADGTMTMREGMKPTLQFWDAVKRGLDDKISSAQRSGENEAARDAIRLKTYLVDHLDQMVPSYAQARSGAAHFFGAENALEAGQNFVMQKMANGEARQALARMSPTERQLFQDGFVSRYMETLESTGDRRSILNTVANSPQAREKLEIALGPQKANELEVKMRVEGIMDLARSAVQGNSTTARQLAELGFAGGAGSLGAHGMYSGDPKEMGAAAIAGALLAGKRGIDTRVAQQVATMLTSNDPQHILRGVSLIARNQRFMDALRVADGKLAQAGGQQAPTSALPALQSPAVGRADQQPDVPRPPGQ